jgi:hypothetical protein
MNFTPKMSVVSIVRGALTIAVVGLVAWVNHVAPAPTAAAPKTIAVQEASPANGHLAAIPAVVVTPAFGPQASPSEYFTPVHRHRRSWWRRNAPIVGGAGGGALVGGLAGGPAGMAIGGAAGAGGGALYRRSRRHRNRW